MPQKFVLLAIVLACLSGGLGAAEQKIGVGEGNQQVATWNRFAEGLLALQQHLVKIEPQKKQVQSGQYGGSMWGDTLYTDTLYHHKKTKQLTAKIRKVKGDRAPYNTLEVYLRDKKGILWRDYTVAYLPGFPNAPYQTLINFHDYNEGLHGIRQFDASGRLIYEQCTGKYFGDAIDLRLEDYEIPDRVSAVGDGLLQEAYRVCFQHLSKDASAYLNPKREIARLSENPASREQVEDPFSATELKIARYTRDLKKRKNDAGLFLKRGQAHFKLRHHEAAIEDFTRALKLDDSLDEAYFGRGMALGRAGEIKKGIADLTVYIERNPTSSLAYTKRGVRHIWAGQLEKARKDLEQAVFLDKTNSEAHDDLGVIYSERKDYKAAVEQFQLAIKYDPRYQKAYHNLAVAYYIMGANDAALKQVDQSLSLSPRNRSSLMLKGTILKDLGRHQEAKAVIETAEFLPKGNWSERFEIR